jgi:hypothetical protein
VHWNPVKGDLRARVIKPCLAVGPSPVIGSSAGSGTTPGGAFAGSQTQVTVGKQVGGGVDFILGRRWSLGLSAGYNWMADLAEPIAGRDNYSGFEVGLNIGWLFGKGSPGGTGHD